jgi:hypothetical protein
VSTDWGPLVDFELTMGDLALLKPPTVPWSSTSGSISRAVFFRSPSRNDSKASRAILTFSRDIVTQYLGPALSMRSSRIGTESHGCRFARKADATARTLSHIRVCYELPPLARLVAPQLSTPLDESDRRSGYPLLVPGWDELRAGFAIRKRSVADALVLQPWRRFDVGTTGSGALAPLRVRCPCCIHHLGVV